MWYYQKFEFSNDIVLSSINAYLNVRLLKYLYYVSSINWLRKNYKFTHRKISSKFKNDWRVLNYTYVIINIQL